MRHHHVEESVDALYGRLRASFGKFDPSIIPRLWWRNNPFGSTLSNLAKVGCGMILDSQYYYETATDVQAFAEIADALRQPPADLGHE